MSTPELRTVTLTTQKLSVHAKLESNIICAALEKNIIYAMPQKKYIMFMWMVKFLFDWSYKNKCKI